jgi:hypothetical protein
MVIASEKKLPKYNNIVGFSFEYLVATKLRVKSEKISSIGSIVDR